MNIELNPNLDVSALAEQFASSKRLRIESLLTTDSAEFILENLKNNTAWHLVHATDGQAPEVYRPEQLESLGSQQLQDIYAKVHGAASSGYQFVYKFFPIIDAIQSNQLPPSSMMYQLAAFLNGTEFLRFARDLTAANTLVKVDPQASLYEAGHFLNIHDDTNDKRSKGDGSIRRFAIVLGFTKNWSPNWGGQTMFFDSPHSDRAESWNPGFNTLSIFQVPVLHSVSCVAPFAPKGRYSVTGWLRDHPGKSRPDLGD